MRHSKQNKVIACGSEKKEKPIRTKEGEDFIEHFLERDARDSVHPRVSSPTKRTAAITSTALRPMPPDDRKSCLFKFWFRFSEVQKLCLEFLPSPLRKDRGGAYS